MHCAENQKLEPNRPEDKLQDERHCAALEATRSGPLFCTGEIDNAAVVRIADGVATVACMVPMGTRSVMFVGYVTFEKNTAKTIGHPRWVLG